MARWRRSVRALLVVWIAEEYARGNGAEAKTASTYERPLSLPVLLSRPLSLPSDQELRRHGCDPTILTDWLSRDLPLVGYHLLCVAPFDPSSPSDPSGGATYTASEQTGGQHTIPATAAATRDVLVFREGMPSATPLTGALQVGGTMEDLRDDIGWLVGVARHLNPWHDAGQFFQLCRNEHESCQAWASAGECLANPAFMSGACGGSCGTCNATQDKPLWQGQPWAMFGSDASGLRLSPVSTPEQVRGMVLLFEGGQFLWPGVHVGFQRAVVLGPESEVVLETLSLSPLVLSVHGFLSPTECDAVVALAAPHLRPSGVAHKDHDKGRPAGDFRTSTSCFLPSEFSSGTDAKDAFVGAEAFAELGSVLRPWLQREQRGQRGQQERAAASVMLSALDDRVAALVRVPRQHQEALQVLKYEAGQRYGLHVDYWDPAAHQAGGGLDKCQGGFSNRLATVFMYLADLPSGGGGETHFPLSSAAQPSGGGSDGGGGGGGGGGGADSAPGEPDSECGGSGLSVAPSKGAVLLFYSLRPDGRGDPASAHAACPVKAASLAGGEGGSPRVKWAANKWVWNTRKGFVA